MEQQQQQFVSGTKERFLSGGGAMEQLIRNYDWSNNPLGPMLLWPQSLKTALNICLHNTQPSVLYWGREQVRFYNDAYAEMIGERHPSLLGSVGAAGFPEVWKQIGRLVENAYEKGISGHVQEIKLMIRKNGREEESYFSFFFSPVFNEQDAVGGILLNISQEINSRRRLEESEERLRMAIQSTRLGTWDYDPVSGELDWSDECRAIYAFPPDKQVNFQVFSDHIFAEDKEFALTEINKAMAPGGKGDYDITYRIIRYDDGCVRWIRATGKVYFDGHRNAERFIGTVVDITDQKTLLLELKESETRFKIMADTAPAMIWTSGPDKTFDFFNKGWLDFTGRKMEEEAGDGWTSLIHQDDRLRCMNIYNESFENRRNFSLEFRMQRSDGRYRWISNEGAPRHSADGAFLGYIGACVDIQERKMAREELEKKVLERTSELNRKNAELREQKEFVDTILESSVDVIAVLDRELRYVTLNRTACEVYKVKKEDLIGKKMQDVYPLIRISGMLDDLKEALKGITIHTPRYRSTVLEKNFENFYIPLKDRNNEVYGVLLVSHDTTAIVEATEKIVESNRALEEKNLALERSNRELESFSYAASHDLQEPLRKIRTFVELVQQNLHDEKTAKRYFSKIDSSAKRMAELIKAVLNYSRLSKTDDHFIETDLNLILRNVRSDFELLRQETEAVIKSNKLPVINGVPLQMHQLFSNLIGNSIKFCEEKPRITITSKMIEAENMPLHAHIQPNTTYVEIIFKDNGIGFDLQYSDQIFTIFKRLHGNQTYNGTGIGLALCKRIVDNHGGFIAVQSEPGKGSEFFIYLPMKTTK